MEFKLWFESLETISDKIFSRRESNLKISSNKILQAVGINSKKPLQIIGKGSLATVYKHPVDPTKIIKVTGDSRDYKNLINATKRNIPDIPKVYNSAKLSNNTFILVLDYISGTIIPYSTSALHALIQGENFDDLSEAIKNIFDESDNERNKILDNYSTNNHNERVKLSRLFRTLLNLERIGIELFDYSENIIDDGKRYIVIDMGE